jgi:aminoglycoside 2''-phosphotransferase
LTGVIDFGDSMVGDPHWDLIYLLEDYGQEFFELFLTFYVPATAPLVRRRVQLFQQLNNIDYCLSQLSEGKQADLADALHVLILQATNLALPQD